MNSPRPVSAALLAWLGWLTLGPAGCRFFDSGLGDAGPVSARRDDDAARPLDGAAPEPDAPPDGPADRPPRPDLALRETLSIAGLPEDIGCSDGTREGYLDPTAWRNIASCAGAWNVPGLLVEAARMPRCGRASGNSGANAAGFGCSVADLCAAGWHVCRNAVEVGQRSPTDCESAQQVGGSAFFVVAAGASPLGICGPDPAAANDLHGCGSIGQPEAQTCQPLERRMGFSDCQASGGVWSCGAAADHLNEANLVTKGSADLGGALCCRDK